MDTSHLAEHAGTAGTLFASIFVVSMTTMKTMVPLRVFGILLNLVLIGTAIPTHNYLTIAVQSVVVLGIGTWALWSVAGDKPAVQSGTPAGASAKLKAAALSTLAAKGSVSGKLLRAGWDDDFRRQLLNLLSEESA